MIWRGIVQQARDERGPLVGWQRIYLGIEFINSSHHLFLTNATMDVC